MIDIIGYGCLAPIPLWGFLWIIYMMYLDSEHGVPCKECRQRHFGLCSSSTRLKDDTPPESSVKARAKEVIPFIVILGVGAIIVIIVQFTPY